LKDPLPLHSPLSKMSSKLQFFIVVEKLYWARGWVGVLIQMGLRISGRDCSLIM